MTRRPCLNLAAALLVTATVLIGCTTKNPTNDALPPTRQGSATVAPSAATSAEAVTRPVLTDDKGRPVPNPNLVTNVYGALVDGDTSALDSSGWLGLNSTDLKDPKVSSSVAKSMTVHPNCDDGCTYPDFAVTGWSSATARADGIKLGVDPARVPDPRTGHGLPVYTSEFPVCMCSWNGAFAPGS
jgi:hypothetical protein